MCMGSKFVISSAGWIMSLSEECAMYVVTHQQLSMTNFTMQINSVKGPILCLSETLFVTVLSFLLSICV